MDAWDTIKILEAIDPTKEQLVKVAVLLSETDMKGYKVNFAPERVKKWILKKLGEKRSIG